MGRVIAVTSGKGGVGKTHLSINLALHCASAGLRTCVFDADLGLANANLLLKLAPRHTLADVLAGRCAFADIVQHAFGIDVVPGSSGVERMADLAPAELGRLGDAFRVLAGYDLIVVDTASGVADSVLAFVAAAPEVLLVITPEPTALTDAYALIKLLRRRHYGGHIRVVVNQAQSEHQARHTYEKFREVVRVYQGLDVPLLGAVPWDARVAEAVGMQTPVSLLSSGSQAGPAFAELAAALLREPRRRNGDDLAGFWTSLTGAEPVSRSESRPAVGVCDAVHDPVVGLADDISIRLGRLEARVDALVAAVHERARGEGDRPSAEPVARAHSEEARHEPLRESPRESPLESFAEPLGEVPGKVSGPASQGDRDPAQFAPRAADAQQRRRAGEPPSAGRSLRAATRATPIDALQLRRVVGRMLVKAMPDSAEHEAPVEVAVDQLQLEGDNEFNLRAGRYTRVSLHCAHIESPDRFIEEIFANCAITGCKVRHLGSHVRYWVTGGRDGCIVLDGVIGERNCVQVYMAAAGNSPLEALNLDVAAAVPRLRRVSRGEEHRGETMRTLLGKFPHERVGADGDGESVVYRLSRRDREPLLCAFHRSDEESGVAALRERSP